MISKTERNVDDESYDEADERLRNIDHNEDDQPYFPIAESKPPHY